MRFWDGGRRGGEGSRGVFSGLWRGIKFWRLGIVVISRYMWMIIVIEC